MEEVATVYLLTILSTNTPSPGPPAFFLRSLALSGFEAISCSAERNRAALYKRTYYRNGTHDFSALGLFSALNNASAIQILAGKPIGREEMEALAEENVHQRVLKLRDAALGSRRSISVDSSLAHASYECVVDSLLSLYIECSSETSGLTRDKHISRFLSKCECVLDKISFAGYTRRPS